MPSMKMPRNAPTNGAALLAGTWNHATSSGATPTTSVVALVPKNFLRADSSHCCTTSVNVSVRGEYVVRSCLC